MITAIKEKNLSAITFWLKHHHPVYENRIRLDGRIKHETEALTDEQEQLVSRALAMVGLLPNEAIKEQDNE